nr:MAG TPA: hypothetical protein [Bacteriophage sp.]
MIAVVLAYSAFFALSISLLRLDVISLSAYVALFFSAVIAAVLSASAAFALSDSALSSVLEAFVAIASSIA